MGAYFETLEVEEIDGRIDALLDSAIKRYVAGDASYLDEIQPTLAELDEERNAYLQDVFDEVVDQIDAEDLHPVYRLSGEDGYLHSGIGLGKDEDLELMLDLPHEDVVSAYQREREAEPVRPAIVDRFNLLTPTAQEMEDSGYTF